MKTDYADMDAWVELASARKIRLPQKNTPLTTGRMEKLLKVTGRSLDWYKEWSGFRTLKDFIKANPEWSARAFGGLCLEP